MGDCLKDGKVVGGVDIEKNKKKELCDGESRRVKLGGVDGGGCWEVALKLLVRDHLALALAERALALSLGLFGSRDGPMRDE